MSGYFTAQDPAFQGEPQAVRDAASPLLHVAAAGPATLLIVGAADAQGLSDARAYTAAMTHYAKADDERRQAVPERVAGRRAREENERTIPAVTGGRVVARPVPVYHVLPPGYGEVAAAGAIRH